MSDVKQAAERLRIADSYGVDMAAMLTVDGLDAQLPRDLVAIMRAYLAEHLADDDEAITEDWLSGAYSMQQSTSFRRYEIAAGIDVLIWSFGPDIQVRLFGHAIPHITTRGQLRKLLAALVTT